MHKSTKQLVVAVNTRGANFRVAIIQSRTGAHLLREIGEVRSVRNGSPSGRISRVIELARLLSLAVMLVALAHPLRVLGVVGPASISLAWDRNPEVDVVGYAFITA